MTRFPAGAPGGQGVQPRQQLGHARPDDGGPLVERRPGGGEGPAHRRRVEVGVRADVLGQAGGLTGQRALRPPRHRPDDDVGGHEPRAATLGGLAVGLRALGGEVLGSSMMTWALVPLMPNDDTPARRGRSTRRPRPRLGRPARPRPPTSPRAATAHPRAASRGSTPVPHRQHHLDHTGDTRRGLRVADVRLHRPQPQRPSRRGPAHTSPAAPAPRSDHPASCPCRAPPPRPHRPRTARRLASACRITRCCDGPFGAVNPFDAPSWFTALPRTTASTGCPLRRASDNRSTTSTPTPSPQPVPSAPAANALHRPSGGQPTLPRELHERRRASPSPSRRRPAPGRHSPAAAPAPPDATPPTTTNTPCPPSPPAPPTPTRTPPDPTPHSRALPVAREPLHLVRRHHQQGPVVLTIRARRTPRSANPATTPAQPLPAPPPPTTTSNNNRCCGSIANASRGEIPKKPASNSAASYRKPPLRT